jgi:uncharacterized protein (DUF849 family)
MLVKAAINGARRRDDHPALPTTTAQIAAVAGGVMAAGAGAVHLHVRSMDGRESLEAQDVARIVAAVRASAPQMPVGISTGAWIVPDLSQRRRALSGWTTTPDFASVNFDEDGAEGIAELLLSLNVQVEAGIADARAAVSFVGSRVRDRCLRVLLEPQDSDAGVAFQVVERIEHILDLEGVKAPRLLHGSDATAWILLDASIARGYDARIGFEDTLTLPDGLQASSNEILVSEALRRMGRN